MGDTSGLKVGGGKSLQICHVRVFFSSFPRWPGGCAVAPCDGPAVAEPPQKRRKIVPKSKLVLGLLRD
eukprot:7194985-Alexandrium_andersonii.AAC.1